LKKDMLFRDLVQLDLEAADQTEVFKRMADILFKKGFVKETYLESLRVREESLSGGTGSGKRGWGLGDLTIRA
jgi:PTS system galactitol-specific IIA component